MTVIDEGPQYVVLGEQRYRVDRDWGKLAPGTSLGLVSTLAVSDAGRVLVYQRGSSPVISFRLDGTFEGSWGEGAIADAHGINVDPLGRVLLADRDAHQIHVHRPDGDRVMSLGERHRPRLQAPFNHPTSAAGAADGEIYVADGYGNAAVHRFSADGEWLATWGRPGNGPGEFSTPHSIWVDRSDRVLVADRENDRIQVFDRDGGHITSWTGFYHPMDIFEDARGFVHVTDQTPRLSMLDPDGRLVGRCRPVWNVPHGVAGSPSGEIFLTEMNPSSITCLVPWEDDVGRSSGS
jgi:peptidylglycine monooxygenase